MRVRRTVLAAFALTLVLSACGDDPSTGERPPHDEPLPAWVPLPDPPVEPRDGAAIAWTGREIVAVGGSTFLCPPNASCAPSPVPPLRDGVALDPETRTWRPIADAPLPVPAFTPTAAVGGDVFLLVPAEYRPDRPPAPFILLRYRSTADAWEAIATPEGTPQGRLVATADAVVVHPTTDERGEHPDLRYDPATGAWSPLPPDPLRPSFDRTIAAVADDLYLFAKEITPSPGGASGPALVHAAVLHEGEWRTLPTGDVLSSSSSPVVDGGRIVFAELGCADGGEVNNFGRCIPFGGIFDTASGSWQPLPPGAGEGPRGGSRTAGAWSSEQVLVTGPREPMLDLRTDLWSILPPVGEGDGDRSGTARRLAGAGPYALAFGGARFDEAQPNGTLLGDAHLWIPPR
jgi:hypothetical protein